MEEVLDLCGLKCPLPALMARRALARLPQGTMLTVRADDPLASVDIPHMCHREGHAIESIARHDDYVEFRLRAAVSPEAAASRSGEDGQ
jgi:tRNA 2-thiouridine synthesizing protein A